LNFGQFALSAIQAILKKRVINLTNSEMDQFVAEVGIFNFNDTPNFQGKKSVKNDISDLIRKAVKNESL